MNRIDRKFSELKAEGKKAFVAYLVAADPNLTQSAAMIRELDRAEVGVVELGIPFSDPLADGVVNQLGAQRAIASGTTIRGILKMIRDVRKDCEVPIVLFTYYNPIFSFGVERFSDEALAAGVDGILLLDLPPEELDSEWKLSTDIHRISLIAPTTPEDRIRKITGKSSGFIYYVSREGVTGMQSSLPTGIEKQLDCIRQSCHLPICVGFGISNPEQAAQVARHADGVVVGSAIVDRIGEWGDQPGLSEKLFEFVRPMVKAVNGESSS